MCVNVCVHMSVVCVCASVCIMHNHVHVNRVHGVSVYDVASSPGSAQVFTVAR